MKAIKWTAISLVVLTVGLLVVGYAMLSSFDVEAYRDVIQAEVKKATGRDLKLDGPVDLRVSLNPAITVEQVSLGNSNWGSRPEMVSVKRFEVEAALMPLLSGEVQVRRLVLVEPDILVEVDAEGRSNLDFGAGATEESATSSAPDFAIAVDRVAIEKGLLTYRDARSGEEQVVTIESLEAEAASVTDPVALTLLGSLNDLPFEVEGAFGSFRQLNTGPFPLEMQAKAAGATVEIKGAVAQPMTGQGLDLSIVAQGEQIAELGTLVGAPVPALGAYEASAKLTQEGALYRLSEIAASLAGASVQGALALSVEGEAPAITALDLAVANKGESLADLNVALGLELPAIGPYDIAFNLGPAGETFDGTAFALSDLAAKLGNSDLSGSATVNLAGERPALSGSFTAGTLDLAELAPAGEGGDTGASGGTVIPNDPIPLEGLRAADAEVKLTAGQVVLPNGMALSDLDLALTLNGGRLALAPLTAGLSGGRVAADLSLDGASQVPSLSLALDVDQLDYGRLLKEQGIEETVAGRVDVTMNVTGAGASPHAIADSLNGTAEVSGRGGVISNRLLKIVAVGLGDVLGPLFGNDQDAKLNCVLANFDIKSGVATTTPLIVDSEVFTVSGGGTIDLGREQLDLAFDTETREASIASLAVPFNVTGSFASPTVAPDPLGTALGVAKTAGMVINPVAGLGVLIGERLISSGDDDNPCAAALTEASSGGSDGGIVQGAGEAVGGAAQGAAEAVEGAAQGASEAVEDAVEGIGQGLKNLFGD